jgi:hypothetical protein
VMLLNYKLNEEKMTYFAVHFVMSDNFQVVERNAR